MEIVSTEIIARLLDHPKYEETREAIVSRGGHDLVRCPETFLMCADARRHKGLFFLGVDGKIALRHPGLEGPDAAWISFLKLASLQGIIGPQNFTDGRHCARAIGAVSEWIVVSDDEDEPQDSKDVKPEDVKPEDVKPMHKRILA